MEDEITVGITWALADAVNVSISKVECSLIVVATTSLRMTNRLLSKLMLLVKYSPHLRSKSPKKFCRV